LTARSSGKAAATSGSRQTIRWPSAKRSAYLPLTTPSSDRKSYSRRISSLDSGEHAIFIVLPFAASCLSATDDSYRRTVIGVNDDEQPSRSASAHWNEAVLSVGMIGVKRSQRQRVAKDSKGLLTCQAVFLRVGSCFFRIPQKIHGRRASGSTSRSRRLKCVLVYTPCDRGSATLKMRLCGAANGHRRQPHHPLPAKLGAGADVGPLRCSQALHSSAKSAPVPRRRGCPCPRQTSPGRSPTAKMTNEHSGAMNDHWPHGRRLGDVANPLPGR